MAEGGVILRLQKANEAETGVGTEAVLDFATLYADNFEFVWRNLRRLGVEESRLRDATQEVFFVVYRRLNEFEPRGSLRSWVYSILRRVALAHKRKSARAWRNDVEIPETLSDDSGSNPEQSLVRDQALRVLLELLDELDDDKRDALVLIDLEGLSVPEACAALDVNQNTLYSRLRVARERMRHAFKQRQLEDWRRT